MVSNLRETATSIPAVEQTKKAKHSICAEEIKAWLIDYLVDILEIEAEEIDSQVNFDDYGLDSEVAVGLTGDLEIWLERKINPTLLYNYTNIDSLSIHLAKEMSVSS